MMPYYRGCASLSCLYPLYQAARLIHDQDGPHRELHHVTYSPFAERLCRSLGAPERRVAWRNAVCYVALLVVATAPIGHR